MSTDQQTPPRTDPGEDQPEAGTNESAKKRLIDLSLTQVLAGALAAMTAAAIGSRLGAAGTIIGAAAASVVAAVAGAVYTASLRHTHEKVRTVWSGRWNSATPGTMELVSDRADATAATALPQHTASTTRRGTLFPFGVRLPWKRALAGALLAFGIAAAVLTGFELISGQALSGGEGTTVTQVSKRDGGADPVKTDPDSTAREKTPAASSEPTSEPTQSAEPRTSTSPTPGQTTPTTTPEPAETRPPTARPSTSAPIPSGSPPIPSGSSSG